MEPWEKIQPWEKWRADGGNSIRWQYDDLTESSLVLDLGGFKGEFASEINERYGCKVLVFEPHPVFFEECKKNLQGNSKIQVFNYGIADVDAEFNLSDNKDASSFFIKSNSEQGFLCKVKSYSSIVKELGIKEVDLIKINIEGGEYDLLDHILEQGFAPSIKNFQIQFHLPIKDAMSRRQKIMEQLSNTHTQTWCYDFIWENWTRKYSK